MTVYAVVRVRGRVGVKGEIEETLRRLRLTRVNHANIVPATPTYTGMIKKAKDYITWGEINAETLELIIRKRGVFLDGTPFSEEELKKRTGMDLKTFVKKVLAGEIKFSEYFKPLRFRPPRGGYRNIKQPYKLGGALGYRGDDINDLLRRMV